jgi:hypothetical protein
MSSPFCNLVFIPPLMFRHENQCSIPQFHQTDYFEGTLIYLLCIKILKNIIFQSGHGGPRIQSTRQDNTLIKPREKQYL